MKKYFIFCMLVLFAGNAFANQESGRNCPNGRSGMKLFKQIDANQDKVATKEEITAYYKMVFASIDTNRDGRMSRKEAKAAEREEFFLSQAAKKNYLTYKETFAAQEMHYIDADVDQDGRVTKREFKKQYLALNKKEGKGSCKSKLS